MTNNFFDRLYQEWADAFRHGPRNLPRRFRNQIRHFQNNQFDYVVLPLGGTFPPFDPPPLSFIQRQLPIPEPDLSLQSLYKRLRRIQEADNADGLLILLRDLNTGFATLQNIRQAISRVRDAGKKVAVYTPYLTTPHYFLASAADTIIAPPSAEFGVIGLRSEAIFLKDTLAQLGITGDFIQISPYKSANNIFNHNQVTPEQAEQMKWLLDETFDLITTPMAAGRNLPLDTLHNLIDQAPFFAHEAQQHNLIDHVAYEDDLPHLLATNTPISTATETDDDKSPPIQLAPWSKAAPKLLEKPVRYHDKHIGIIPLIGTIIMGPSQNAPPIDLPLPVVNDGLAGEETIIQLIRQAEQDDDLAALIFYIDSPGGVALASDLIWRELDRLGQKIPILAYMGDVAASGGYYVAAPAQHIMAQTGTITGSIGVLIGRFALSGLYDKLKINRYHVARGRHAGLYSSPDPLTDEERALIEDAIHTTYDQFKQVVADGRDLPIDQLDPICEGRVWTGRQALNHQLIDSHGDLLDAINQAAQLANLPQQDNLRIPVVTYQLKDSHPYQLPQASPTQDLLQLLNGQRLRHLQGHPLYLLPYHWQWW
ncbi:MAG TPA: signal peptide peptidase SppA [Anaerolineae bacterium]|nr:signal peptide peptidase SppA [Anaerolineae bacterium]